MYTLIKYDRILILQNYGILEIPCSIPLFRIGLPNPRKKNLRKISFFHVRSFRFRKVIIALFSDSLKQIA